MTIYLYQQSANEAFRLSERAILKTGFVPDSSDDLTGFINGRKQLNSDGNIIFLDIKITRKLHLTSVSVISNVFSADSGTFIADGVSEELFVETLHDLLRITPPENPFRITQNDYALAACY